MAVVVDVKSSYKGEQIVRNAIEDFFTDDAVVYNNREVNGREYDICLLVKDVCVFIVEVKGWLASKIKVHGVDAIEVEGYEEWQTSPKKQAKSYCIQYFSKIKKQFGSSPLVVDLVAYPFITKEQYYSSRLDIISEEQFTIFEDDLQDQNSLKRKFQAAFDAKKGIPHAELDAEFLGRIRRFEEPSFDDSDDEETLKDTVAAALAQIEEKQYAAGLIEHGVAREHIHSYGFAFEGKKVLIGKA